MPNWFAKTKEMAAFDRYFSTKDVSESVLRDRYLQALDRLHAAKYFTQADVLDEVWSSHPDRDTEIQMSLDGHFRGDWVHHLYEQDPQTWGSVGGRFWPQVPTDDVLDRLRAGVILAIYKALGDSELATTLGRSEVFRKRLWKAERENDIDIDDGIRPVALSWNCVAPAGDNYFEVDALRGPTIVEFAIATPRPFGHGTIMHMADDMRAGLLDEGIIESSD